MLCLKKLYREELLQLALLLSLLRVDPEYYLGIDVATMGVGSLDLNNGSGRHFDAHTIIHRPVFVHPKNLDSILLNYERDLFEDLNSLGRYNRLNSGRNDIHAYLLNIEEANREASNSTNISSSSANSERQIPTTGTRNDTQVTSSSSSPAELTQEDMDLIEVLWKQDVDLGFTLVDPVTTNKNEIEEERKKEETEKINSVENFNSTNEKRKTGAESKEEDPWAGLSYTIDLETGEHILQGNQNGSGSSTSEESASQLLNEPELNLSDPSLVDLGDDSLELSDSLNLDNDFATDLLEGNLLGGSAVDGLLSNYSLGLPDGFNLEEALQLVGLDEPLVEKETPEVKEKTEHSESGKYDSKPAESLKAEADKVCEEVAETSSMIHTPQFHHSHPHHRSFHHQGRMPYMRAMSMEQRWQDLTTIFPDFALPTHPGAFTGHGMSHGHYEAPRNVVLHNASLAPPVGDLNATGPYHNVGGPSNLGSAVATSMNLTNSSEPMGTENGAAYKSEPSDMMYYHTPTSDPNNQTTDGFLSSWLDEDIHLMDMGDMADGMYTMRMLENSSNNASGPAGAGALGGVGASGAAANPGVTTLTGVTDERMDASSDSAVSSMGSERVPSLSDGEWMETGSNSSHTQADSHYSMDYAGKYHSPYDYSYPVPGRTGGSPRCQAERAMVPVAQKKHQMFAKRYFQEQGSPLGATSHSATPLKYDYDTHTVAAGAPGNAYTGPIEGAAGPQQPELKYSCSVDFSRHQSGRSAIEHIHHNHTYHLPPETSGSLQRPLNRDKKARKNEGEEHLTRDEKRARALSVPIAVSDIINLPMDEFNERLSKYDLSESQLSLIRDIRRRGKNKVAAQNCRKRKLDQIISLADQVKEMRDRKMRLIRERDFMLLERQRVKDKFNQLYRHIFQSLRDSDGNSYSSYHYVLQHSADGNVVLVPRNQTNPHHPRSSMEPKTKPDSDRKE